MTPRTICKSVKLRESRELLCGRFCLKLKGAYIARPAILHREFYEEFFMLMSG